MGGQQGQLVFRRADPRRKKVMVARATECSKQNAFEGTNLKEDKSYDQIVHSPTREGRFTDKGGVIRFYDESHEEVFAGLSLHEFTHQLSDHLPLWIEVDTWIEGEQLDAIIRGADPEQA